MASTIPVRTPLWAWLLPLLGCVMLVWRAISGQGGVVDTAAAVILIGMVFAAVYHAEVVAHRVGEPFGTLVLAVAFTVIEVALIVTVMAGGGAEQATLARDTVFAAVMIVCNGITGVSLLAGGAKHGQQTFRSEGANAALAVLAALTILTLVLPDAAVGTSGAMFNTPKLIYAGVTSLILYGSFAFIQTIRHREFFLSATDESEEHAALSLPALVARISAILLLISLAEVAGLAKLLTPALERGVVRIGAPASVVGIVIAALVLLPEGLAAINAARANRLQSGMNLAWGSALSTIGLTIPAVAVASAVLAQPIALGLTLSEDVLLALTLLVSIVTLSPGRTTVLQGIVHVIIFAAFLFFAVVS